MQNELQATVRASPQLMIIDLQGDVTTFADEAINTAYRLACDQGAENILLNFTKVAYVNSAGISSVIGILTQVREADQSLLVMGLTPHYQKIFQIMGLAQYIPIFDSEDAARQHIEA